MGRVQRRRNATTRDGRVVKQSPKPGTVLAPDTVVTVTLGASSHRM